MKRRFNYTDRKRITKDMIKININRTDGMIKSINASINIDPKHYDQDDKVFIVAYHKTDRKRFDYGRINEIKEPDDLSVDELAYTDNLKFRVMIISDKTERGLIAGHADRVRPDDEIEKKSILPVSFVDLGQQIWKLDFNDSGGGPILNINKNIPFITNVSKTDPLFFMYVYPAVIKEILHHMIFFDGVENVDDPPIEWHADWLKFSKIILPNLAPPSTLQPDEEDFNSELTISWIDDIVDEFCSGRKEWVEYITIMQGSSL